MLVRCCLSPCHGRWTSQLPRSLPPAPPTTQQPAHPRTLERKALLFQRIIQYSRGSESVQRRATQTPNIHSTYRLYRASLSVLDLVSSIVCTVYVRAETAPGTQTRDGDSGDSGAPCAQTIQDEDHNTVHTHVPYIHYKQQRRKGWAPRAAPARNIVTYIADRRC